MTARDSRVQEGAAGGFRMSIMRRGTGRVLYDEREEKGDEPRVKSLIAGRLRRPAFGGGLLGGLDGG
jgi:hypothetical protein